MCVYLFVYVCMYVYVCVCVCMYVCICACVYVCDYTVNMLDYVVFVSCYYKYIIEI